MSSFSSSVINKSGKKVAPKAPPRRRLGAAAVAREPSVSSTRTSVEPTHTPQPDPSVDVANPQQTASSTDAGRIGGLTVSASENVPSTTPIPRTHVLDSTGIPLIQPSAGPSKVFGPSDLHGVKGSVTAVNPPIPHYARTPPIITVSSATRTRSRSPTRPAEVGGERSPKRRRVEEIHVIQSLGSRTETVRSPSRSPALAGASGSTSSHGPQNQPNADGIPQVVATSSRSVQPISSRSETTTDSRNASAADLHSQDATSSSIATHRPTDTNGESLVPYEVPAQVASNGNDTAGTTTSGPTSAPKPSSAPATSKPRSKSSRKDQWQVSTPADLAAGRGKRKSRQTAEVPDEDEESQEQPAVTAAPKTRKPRKDKGQKKGAKSAQGNYQADITAEPAAEGNATERVHVENEDVAATGSEPEPEPEPEPGLEPTTTNNKNSARLKNLQKRKAKQLAKGAALARFNSTATASAIDFAVQQSVEGRTRTPISRTASRTPVAQQPRRESTTATDRTSAAPSTAETEVTENGTVRKRRSRRAPTPEENENVFIIESQTQMWDLAKRDTENRVGFKSEREKLMRKIDWADVKRRRKEEDIRLSRLKGKKGAQQELEAERAREDAGDGNDEDLDESELLERALAKRKARGHQSLKIRLVNGEHVIDESSQYIDRRAQDNEEEPLEEVDEDDLTRHFNVHTYGTWRRKDVNERVVANEKWNVDDTERFYDALSAFGTDFMIISSQFPGRTRRQIKAKFVREEHTEPERVHEALLAHTTKPTHDINSARAWDLNTFTQGAGIALTELKDPRQVEEELRKARESMEREIEKQREETKEMERQMRLAGLLDSDDEGMLDPQELVRRADKEAKRVKRERERMEKKERARELAGGGVEEVVETIEDDDE